VKGDGGEGGEDGKGIDEVIQREKNSTRGRGKEKRRKRKEVRCIRLITSHLISSQLISPSRPLALSPSRPLALSPSRHLAISPPLRRSLKPPHLCPRPRQVHADPPHHEPVPCLSYHLSPRIQLRHRFLLHHSSNRDAKGRKGDGEEGTVQLLLLVGSLGKDVLDRGSSEIEDGKGRGLRSGGLSSLIRRGPGGLGCDGDDRDVVLGWTAL
jgi:hypothetical protein